MADSQDEPVDPLANLIKLLTTILNVILQTFIKIFPIIGIGFIVILLLLYLFFKMFGLV